MSKRKINEILREINELVAWFDGEESDIDEAFEKFDKLTKLVDEAKTELGEIENKITVLEKKFNEQ